MKKIYALLCIVAYCFSAEQLAAHNADIGHVPALNQLEQAGMSWVSNMGYTHGDVAVSKTGEIYVSTTVQGAGMLVLDSTGNLKRTINGAPTDLHGFILREEAGQEYIYGTRRHGQSFIKMSLEGKRLLEVVGTRIPEKYHNKDPRWQEVNLTSIAVDDNGDIFVVDGYGMDFIHQFDNKGAYVKSFGGREKPYFLTNCHKIIIDRRYTPRRLLCTDRYNKRLVHMAMTGELIGDYAKDLRRPSDVAFWGEYAAIAEIAGRISLLDKSGKLAGVLSLNEQADEIDTLWTPPKKWEKNIVTAPHGLAFDEQGNLYVTEWNHYGRVLKFTAAQIQKALKGKVLEKSKKAVTAKEPLDNNLSFQPTETSLEKHQAAPNWFRDAKLGIYFHWGPYTVAEKQNEWYARWMHFGLNEEDWEGHKPGYHHDLMAWHTEKFGHPSEFGYHDLIPLFTGENFDAEEWAQLFADTGAKFAGPVAMHHDGYALWDSQVTPWNAAITGPKKDITGELSVALRKRGMKLITTFHHARQLQRYKGMSYAQAREKYGDTDQYHVFWDSHYPWIEGLATASEDPKLRLLYGNLPEQEWLEDFWLATLKEVINKYQPDMIWFDTWLDQIPEKVRYEFVSYYLNQAKSWDKEVMVTHKHKDMPISFSVQDFEQGRRDKLTKEPWLTDDTLAVWTWSYVDGMKIKQPARVVHEFIDIVSKNGQLLLNISPQFDGTIPDDQRSVLEALGDWVKVNGDAIYGTRPWVIYGEGPTKMDGDGHFTSHVIYGAKDIRFTTKGDALYAIALGTPKRELLIKSLASDISLYHQDIETVKSLNGDYVESWRRDKKGLKIKLKKNAPQQIAYAFEIIAKNSAH